MNKKLNIVALALVLSAGLTACGPKAENAPANNAAQNNAAANANANADKEKAPAAEVGEMKGEELDKIMEDNKAKENVTVIDVRSPEDTTKATLNTLLTCPSIILNKIFPKLKI